MLVLDTNVLLSSLPMVAALIEKHTWTVVVPLPVIMELDGLSSSGSAFGEAAMAASGYLQSALRPHGISLKIQTSRGNYLPSLAVRAESVDFDRSGGEGWERSMDDLILRAAVFADEHWVDRSALLRVSEREEGKAEKVVLLTMDRNCE